MKVSISRNYDKSVGSFALLMDKAIDKMQEVLASQEFMDALYEEINASNNLEGELSTWKHATVKEIFENLFDKKDAGIYSFSLKLFTYYTSAKVIGYGVATNENIYVNTKYLKDYKDDDLEDLREVGSNLLHEHGHDCGYDHDFKATKRRPNSLAYVLNRAYENAFNRLYKIAPPKPVYVLPWYKRIFQWRK